MLCNIRSSTYQFSCRLLHRLSVITIVPPMIVRVPRNGLRCPHSNKTVSHPSILVHANEVAEPPAFSTRTRTLSCSTPWGPLGPGAPGGPHERRTRGAKPWKFCQKRIVPLLHAISTNITAAQHSSHLKHHVLTLPDMFYYTLNYSRLDARVHSMHSRGVNSAVKLRKILN